MRITKTILAVASIPAILLPACTKDEPLPVGFELETTSIEAPEEGGTFNISYNIENPADNETVQVECSDGWISESASASQDNSIAIAIAPNTGEQRNGEITLTYSDISHTVKVTQAGAAPEFTIEVFDITEVSAKANITPKNPELSYAIAIMPEDQFEEYGKNTESFVAEMKARYSRTAELLKISLEEYIRDKVMKKGEQLAYPFTDLDVAHSYFIVTFGIDSECNALTEIYPYQFSTLSVEMIDFTLDFGITVKGSEITNVITPSDNSVRYYNEYMTEEETNGWYKDNISQWIQDIIYSNIMFGEKFGVSLEETLNTILKSGKIEESKELNANEKYTAVGAAVNDDGYVYSQVSEYEFETGDVQMSGNTFTIEVTDIGISTAKCKVTPTNSDKYVVTYDLAERWEGMTQDEIRNKLQTDYFWGYQTVTGEIESPMEKLCSGTEYTLFVFGYTPGQFTDGTVTTEVFTYDFTTLPQDDPSGMTVTVNVTNVTTDSFDIHLSGNPANAGYLWGLVTNGTTTESIMDAIEDNAANMMEYWGMAKKEYFAQNLVRGETSKSFTDMNSGTEYAVYYVGVNDDLGTYATDIILSDVFSTEERTVSDVTVTLEYGKYFNGEEVAELFPDFAGSENYALMPVEAFPCEDATDYYYQLFLDDLTDPEAYSDDMLIKNLESYGVHNTPGITITSFWDKDVSMIAVAKDSDGNYGKVYRNFLGKLTKDGASPAEEFVIPGSRQKVRTLKTVPSADMQHIMATFPSAEAPAAITPAPNHLKGMDTTGSARNQSLRN